MGSNTSARNDVQVSLRPVDQGNWRDVARLKVTEAQRDLLLSRVTTWRCVRMATIGSPLRLPWVSK